MTSNIEFEDSLAEEQSNQVAIQTEYDDVTKEVTAQPILKTVSHPKPGQVYIALANGRLVPVQPGTLITSQNAASKVNDQAVKLSQTMAISSNCVKQSSMGQNDTLIKKGHIDFKRIIQVTKTPCAMNTKEISSTSVAQKKEIKSSIKQYNEGMLVQVSGKHKTEDELIEQRKKYKPESSINHLALNSNLQFSANDLRTKVESKSGENSLVDNVRNEGSTPENIYESSEDEDWESYGDNLNEGLENENNLCENQDEAVSEDFEEEILDDQTPQNVLNTCSFQSNNFEPVKYTFESSGCKKIVTDQPKKPHTSQPLSGKSPSLKISPVSSTTNKMPRVNDKFPELPVPANLNQYGDCLKTRLGRYHYGLTLNDPPCQFFQGVLKGASGQTLAAMFGDVNLISKFESVSLDEIGHFIIDTTYKVIPNTTVGVNQVLTLSLLHQNVVIPLWYALMSCSSPELYKRILIEFRQHVLDWPFISALVNNDPALCKAIQAVFPDIDLYGSWFHYCYSIWKEVNFHNLVAQCKVEDSTLMTAVKLLMVVPYLPPPAEDNTVSMVDGFEYVRQFARENGLPEEFNRVLHYVAVFWFNNVKAENFTLFGKHTCALNHIETLQLSLLSYMKANGNVWTFTRTFQSVARMTNTDFVRYLSGKRLLVQKNRGKKFNVPIRQNAKKLMSGTLDVKEFLEKSTIYLEEILDIFLHPLYPTTAFEKTNYVHTEGWKIRIYST